MSWQIRWDGHLAATRITVSGRFNAADYRDMIEQCIALPFWQPDTHALVDYRDCSLGAGLDEMVAASAAYSAARSDIGYGRTAIVVGSRADFGSARQFFSVADEKAHVHLQLFTDLSSAEDWLRGG